MATNPDRGEQTLLDNVARYGWHCMKVGSRTDDPVQITFAYSIGLEATFDWPELICLGLELDTLHQLLASAIDELRARQATPQVGVLLEGVINKYACRLDIFPTTYHRAHLGWAMWYARYHGRDPSLIRCLQLVWPDRDGHFPDDPSCNDAVRTLQRPLTLEN